MEITTLFEKPSYAKDVSHMIYGEFVVGTSSRMVFSDVEVFFQNTNFDTFPLTFIAIKNDACVGTVSVFENDFKKRPQYTPWLASLYVQPTYRDQKIGQQLMNYLLNHVKLLGISEIYLKTENASDYYIKRGWKLVETIHETDGEMVDIFKYTP
ncbi:GNAT family N-acetyltransferase [Solibacillus daqui]|uniref:GNAT family N-acetyltransferase n=1 Tax=Solibacillus daqui TaxID=2912187 RepID=UPI00236638FB|nr:GNAT family N-acetyltransferase [Solibacillus daqui]